MPCDKMRGMARSRILLLSLVVGVGIAIAAIAALTPSINDARNAQTAVAVATHAGILPGSPLWQAPSGHTAQDLSGVPGEISP